VIDKESLGLSNRPWTDLLQSSLLGLLAADETRMREIRTQTLVKLPEPARGHVRIRHGLAIDKGPVYMIDSDFFTEERSEPENAFAILAEFNRLASQFFRSEEAERQIAHLKPVRSFVIGGYTTGNPFDALIVGYYGTRGSSVPPSEKWVCATCSP
jgi:hypothetical protein